MQLYPRVVYGVLEGDSVVVRGPSERVHEADLNHTLIHEEVGIYGL